MYCTVCGSRAQDGARYCPHCGARLVVPAEQAQVRPPVQAPAEGQVRPAAQPADQPAAGSTAEFLNVAVESGVVSEQDKARAMGTTAPVVQVAPVEDGRHPIARALGVAFIVAGLLALAAFSVLYAIPQLTGVRLVDVDAIVSSLPGNSGHAAAGDQAGTGAGGTQPDAAEGDPTDPAPAKPATLREAPVDVDVSFEQVALDDERFGYPAWTASQRGTAVDEVTAAFEKDVRAASANALPTSDPKATGTYSGAYASRVIEVTRLANGVASVAARGWQTNGGGRGWNVVDGSNYNLISGAQVSAAELAGLTDAELQELAEEAIGAYIAAHPDVDWWDDDVQTWQENLAEDFETGFVHYVCIDAGVVAAVNELTLAPASAGMVVVFVAPIDGGAGGYEPGDAVDLDDEVRTSGSLTVSAAEVAEALGVELPSDPSAQTDPVDGGSGAEDASTTGEDSSRDRDAASEEEAASREGDAA